MLTWNVTYCCRPGQRESFYQALCALGIRESSRQEEGNLNYAYFFSAHNPDELLLVEQWTTPELQQLHCQTPMFAQLQALKKQYCLDTRIDKFLS